MKDSRSSLEMQPATSGTKYRRQTESGGDENTARACRGTKPYSPPSLYFTSQGKRTRETSDGPIRFSLLDRRCLGWLSYACRQH